MKKNYSQFLDLVRNRITTSQNKVAVSVNTEIIMMYYDIGRMIVDKQKKDGWGSSVILSLSKDISNEFPEIKGFSERNIHLMVQFYKEYSENVILQPIVAELEGSKLQPVVAELEDTKGQPLVALLKKEKNQLKTTKSDLEIKEISNLIIQLQWSKNIALIQKVKDLDTRIWYMRKAIDEGWSKNTLISMIKNNCHERENNAVSNFDEKLPSAQASLAKQILKDPFVFDFMTISEPFKERELELNLVLHIEKFLLELGKGFSFVGRQYHVELSDNDYYIDLLFYHLKLRCFIVIELKKGEYKPEYAGKTNFYCNIIDDVLKHKDDKPTIGLILCQEKEKIIAEYSLRGIEKPIGVSEYDLTKSLPKEFLSSLPSIEEIEEEMTKK